jgi:citrate/tricarballylate utilization protein
MHADVHLTEAARLMTVCNSCRYCEGLCAVFPAMELRSRFAEADLNYLANLCHSCGACYADCQFSPPHEFAVNVPRTLAEVRNRSYRNYAWPSVLRPLFDRNGVAVALIAALAVTAFLLGLLSWRGRATLTSAVGSFYALMPHTLMASLFGAIALYSILALAMGFRNFWREIGADSVAARSGATLWQAARDALSLRYLDGGGPGCSPDEDVPNDSRRIFHHLTFYGFALCFAATVTGTIYHYCLNWPAPYGWTTLPKLFGIPGGIGLIIGPIGLIREKLIRQAPVRDRAALAMEMAFLIMLFLAGSTGLALMLLRETALMGIMLAIHLGVIAALFLTMPYGKFVHGLYRFGALALSAAERRSGRAATAPMAADQGK